MILFWTERGHSTLSQIPRCVLLWSHEYGQLKQDRSIWTLSRNQVSWI